MNSKIAATIKLVITNLVVFGHCVFAQTDGRIPNEFYDEELEQWTIISPQMSSRHMNQPSVFNGYAILAGNGAHEVWDISDPSAPIFEAEMISPYYNPNKEAESHQVSYGRDYAGNYYFATTSGKGIDIWNVTDTVNPTLAASIELPNIDYGDVAGAIWGLSWQGYYLYAGATVDGVYVIDVSNPEKPRLVRTADPFYFDWVLAGPVFALGDLLVVTTPKGHAGIATVNISNPFDLEFMDSDRPATNYTNWFSRTKSYIGGFYGNHAFLINPLRFYDVTTDPYNIREVATFPIPESEYVSFDNDHLFLGGLRGGTEGIHKYSIKDPDNVQKIGWVRGRDTRWDDQFSCPVGNLVIMADDQFVDNRHVGAVIGVHDAEPDLTPPTVKAVYPANGATSLSNSGQVAVSFSEWIEFKSVNPSTFILRPVNGKPLEGTWGCTYTVLNFSSKTALKPATEYEIVLPFNGITDLVGNPLAATYISRFTTPPILGSVSTDIEIAENPSVELGLPSYFSVVSPNPKHTYTWKFGDGQTATGSAVSHVYSRPGRYNVSFQADDLETNRFTSKSLVHLVHHPVTNVQPTSSLPMVLADGMVWAVNSDADSVSGVDTTSLAKLFEIPVASEPKSIAHAPDGNLWVTCRKAAEINVINPGNGEVVKTISLPYASQPGGIAFAPDGHAAFVCLQALGRLVKLSPTSGDLLASIDFGSDSYGRVPDVRELAINAASNRIYVARFISPNSSGMVYVVNPATMTLEDTIHLSKSEGVDGSLFARGLPNYLNSITISPDGKRAWVSAKKDNIDRGAQLDGQALGHDNVVRAITSILDLTNNTDLVDQRVDYDNRDRCSSSTFSSRGDLVFVTLPGNHQVRVVDAYSGSEINTLSTQQVPVSSALEASSGRLFVLNFLGRSLSVFDVSPMLRGESNANLIRDVPLLSFEPLPAGVLAGKKIFYDADSKELNIDGYMSCASCHIDGSHDGRTYDFSAPMQEGLRNTIDLRGRAGLEHGRLHWTGNFDEVHDFENQIRLLGQGIGLMNDSDFNEGNRSEPFGSPKANISGPLDDLAAYIHSLMEVPPSPYRDVDGSLTAAGQAGKRHFNRLACYSCHGGEEFTDSKTNLGTLHDVGTLRSQSGTRMGQMLTGIDTPTLRGIWDTAPYLHDGSAATLRDVLTTRNPYDQHGAVSSLSPNELDELIAYLKQIDENEPAAKPVSAIDTETMTLPKSGTEISQVRIYSGQAFASEAGPLGVREGTLRLEDDGEGFGLVHITDFAREIDVSGYQDENLEFWFYSDGDDPTGTIEIQLSFTNSKNGNTENLWKWKVPASLLLGSNEWSRVSIELNERNFMRNSPYAEGNDFNLKRLNRIDVLMLGSNALDVYVDGIAFTRSPDRIQPMAPTFVLEDYNGRGPEIEQIRTYGGASSTVNLEAGEDLLLLQDDGEGFGLVRITEFSDEIDISQYQDESLEFFFYTGESDPEGTIEVQLSFTNSANDSIENLWKVRVPASLERGGNNWHKFSVQLNERNFMRNSSYTFGNDFDLSRLNRIDVLMLESNALDVYVNKIVLKKLPDIIQPTSRIFVLEDYNGGGAAIDENHTYGGGEAYRRVNGPLGIETETLLLQDDSESFGLIYITDFAYEVDIDSYRGGNLEFAYLTKNADSCRTVEIQMSFTNTVNSDRLNLWKWREPASLKEGHNQWEKASVELSEDNFIRDAPFKEGNDFNLAGLNRIAVLVLCNDPGNCEPNQIHINEIVVSKRDLP